MKAVTKNGWEVSSLLVAIQCKFTMPNRNELRNEWLNPCGYVGFSKAAIIFEWTNSLLLTPIILNKSKLAEYAQIFENSLAKNKCSTASSSVFKLFS